MMHFSDEVWLDFSRRLLPPDEASRIQAHLDSGCAECVELNRVWTAVTEIARKEGEYIPDEPVIAAARDAFSAAPWRSWPATESALATLIFDSFFSPGALVGVRSISASARHLLYQAGRLAIDVRIDAQNKMTAIVGQILETPAEEASACDPWHVTLLHGNESLAWTTTNEFGEFYFECAHGTDLRIRGETEGQKPFMLVLPD